VAAPQNSPTRQPRRGMRGTHRWKALRARKAAALACCLWNGLLVPSHLLGQDRPGKEGGATGSVRERVDRPVRRPNKPSMGKIATSSGYGSSGDRATRVPAGVCGVNRDAIRGRKAPVVFRRLRGRRFVPASAKQPAKWGGPGSGGRRGASLVLGNMGSPGCS
jgi:hypothetical protein